MTDSLVTTSYLAAAVLFILSLGGLSTQQTARRGNLFGVVGMALAVIVSLLHSSVDQPLWILVPVGVGASIGAFLAARVAMTAMPELVAVLHSFVGLAAVLVGISSYMTADHSSTGAAAVIHLLEIYFGVAIGALTFTGSIVAWAKLRGTVSGKPLLLPGRHAINAALVAAIVVAAVPFASGATPFAGFGIVALLSMTALASLIGIHLVAAIGGADMPVVVSLLNSYSGWAAAAAGFMLGNDLLIVTGALVGSSGAILSTIMCRAMNRSIWNVVFGGFGADSGAAPTAAAVTGDVTPIDLQGVAELVNAARELVIVPGYGMAVAQAQHPVRQFADMARQAGKLVRYAIHPVAGRLPGHMNVLLAEAGVPYDIVLEMDEINGDMSRTDLILVIGANDIVNPGALDDPGSPIFGMPVIEVWKARHVVVLKRGMASGYAGVDNPLFTRENSRMLFGDAKKMMDGLCAILQGPV